MGKLKEDAMIAIPAEMQHLVDINKYQNNNQQNLYENSNQAPVFDKNIESLIKNGKLSLPMLNNALSSNYNNIGKSNFNSFKENQNSRAGNTGLNIAKQQLAGNPFNHPLS